MTRKPHIRSEFLSKIIFISKVINLHPTHILCKRGEDMKEKDEFIKIFSMNIRNILQKVNTDLSGIQEIRLRAGQPLLITMNGKESFVTGDGRLTGKSGQGWQVSKREIAETLEYIASYSMYAYEDELKQGFLTIGGGHRIGVAGRTILDNGRIRNIKHISFLNVRVSHEIPGCADAVLPYIVNGDEICHTLVISPPGCGKTTLLRDMVRQISNGGLHCRGRTVGVVDERSEIGGAYLGVPQNDLGIRTDLLDCCPKAEGMMLLIRSMAPKVIAVDEIGSEEDIHAIETAVNCGCRILATVHGNGIEDIRRKPFLCKLVEEGVFERYLTLHNLGGVGNVKQIAGKDGRILYG